MNAPANLQTIIAVVKDLKLKEREENAVLLLVNAGTQTAYNAFAALKCYDGLDDEGQDPDASDIAESYGVSYEQFVAAAFCSNDLAASRAVDRALGELAKLEATH